ncbi:hypothetical protein [Salinilacihabitans rarus]|uniref:hypothetical protein n=1 Tax=Salinilacihabitans rarus TaxID=2961596 RepID=UPI0020C8B42A|nr:hypothetical protein [Salinilacihabitans rarus]
MLTISEIRSSVADLARESRSSVVDLDGRTFIGLLVGIVGVGLALRGAYLTAILLDFDLLQALLDPVESLHGLVPFVVGALAYVWNRPAASAVEVGLVVLWGVCAMYVAFLFIFVFGPAVVGDVRISTILASRGAEFILWDLLRSLGTAAVFAGFYAAAASRRDRPLVSALVLLAVPAGIVGVWAIA